MYLIGSDINFLIAVLLHIFKIVVFRYKLGCIAGRRIVAGLITFYCEFD